MPDESFVPDADAVPWPDAAATPETEGNPGVRSETAACDSFPPPQMADPPPLDAANAAAPEADIGLQPAFAGESADEERGFPAPEGGTGVAGIEPPAAAGPDSPEAGAPAVAPASGEDFATLLEASGAKVPKQVEVGQRVRGKITSVGDKHCTVDYGGRAEGVIATGELRAGDGTVLLRAGDAITATVSAAEEPVTFTLGRKRGLLNAAKLRVAYENKQPVSGVVKSTNKGGFDVHVGGVRAFCPLSQIDNAFVGDPASYVRQTYTFRILRWEHGGRNIVLSRRAILKQEAEAKAVETRKRLDVGAEFDGVVTRVQPFGAFVDIGGLEGLLHVSRMGRGHVQDPSQMAVPGQQLRVRISKLEGAGAGKERIALILADLGPDPWDETGPALHEGQMAGGRVVRLTEFGVFVNLLPGVDGLVHISELPKRGAEEAPKPGDEVQVRILKVDRERRRVSLSMRPEQPSEPQAARPAAREHRPERPPRDRDRDRERERESSANGPLTHTMADQLGALRRKLQVRP